MKTRNKISLQGLAKLANLAKLTEEKNQDGESSTTAEDEIRRKRCVHESIEHERKRARIIALERIKERKLYPFRMDYPTIPERTTPVPDDSWCCSQWQAFVERGSTAVRRVQRLRQAPKPLRRRIISHVRTAFWIRTTKARWTDL